MKTQNLKPEFVDPTFLLPAFVLGTTTFLEFVCCKHLIDFRNMLSDFRCGLAKQRKLTLTWIRVYHAIFHKCWWFWCFNASPLQRECHHYRNQEAICRQCDNLHLETIGFIVTWPPRKKNKQNTSFFSSLELSSETIIFGVGWDLFRGISIRPLVNDCGIYDVFFWYKKNTSKKHRIRGFAMYVWMSVFFGGGL